MSTTAAVLIGLACGGASAVVTTLVTIGLRNRRQCAAFLDSLDGLYRSGGDRP